MIYRIPYILAALLGCLIAAQAQAGTLSTSPAEPTWSTKAGSGSTTKLDCVPTGMSYPPECLHGSGSITIDGPPPELCESKTFKQQPTGELVCEKNAWHLLTQTYGGTMQLVKHLSKHECEFMRARALGEPATPEEEKEAAKAQEDYQKCLKARAPITGIYCIVPEARITGVSAGDIKTAECFQ